MFLQAKSTSWAWAVITIVGILNLFNGVIPLQYDNLYYMNAARNLASSWTYINGFNQIETQWHIFYSLSLVPAFFIGLPVEVFARILNLICFLGGVYFFKQFLVSSKENTNVINRTVICSIFSYYIFRSSYLEMPDITLFFFFNFFLFCAFDLEKKQMQNVLLIGLISFISVITKPTGAIFFVAILATFLFSLIFDRSFNKGFGLALLSSFSGLYFAKVLNKVVVDTQLEKGFSINPYWQHVDGGSGNIKLMFENFFKSFTEIDLFFNKVILLGSWFAPSNLFSKFKIILFLISLFLVILIIYVSLKNIFKTRFDQRIIFITSLGYFALCLPPAIQNRHLILIFPFCYWVFFKFISDNKLFARQFKGVEIGSIITFLIVFINLLPSLILLMVGNLKNHGGLYQKYLKKSYYLGEFVDVENIVSHKSLGSGNIYVPENYVRIMSFLMKKNIISDNYIQNINKDEYLIWKKNSNPLGKADYDEVYSNDAYILYRKQ